MNLVCLVIDRWHVGYLGCYGNSWVGTPKLDRLACESFCFDQALIDTPRLDGVYRSLWKGHHALAPPNRIASTPTLPHILKEAGISSTLLTDDPAVADHPLAVDFTERSLVDLPTAESPVSDLADTRLGRFFAAASDWLAEPREPFLLWLHTNGLGSAWDAPLELRNQYVDEEEPFPPNTSDVPRRELPPEFDPDELLGIRRAYAGQAALLDTCIGALDQHLQDSGLGKRALLAVLSARGFPLGEHRLIGPSGDALHAELVHIPWLLRFPDGLGAGARTQSLVQPADLTPTLLDACGIAPVLGIQGISLMPLVRGETDRLRDRAVVISPSGERAIRTPAWYLRVHNLQGGTSEAGAELYLKPDDRWEVNELSGRCHEVVESLRRVLADFEQAQQAGSAAEPPLDEVLVHGLA
jgi:arylsulfatase A-like enzyme